MTFSSIVTWTYDIFHFCGHGILGTTFVDEMAKFVDILPFFFSILY